MKKDQGKGSFTEVAFSIELFLIERVDSIQSFNKGGKFWRLKELIGEETIKGVT